MFWTLIPSLQFNKVVDVLRVWGFQSGLFTVDEPAPESDATSATTFNDASSQNGLGESSRRRTEAIRRREADQSRRRLFWDVLWFDM